MAKGYKKSKKTKKVYKRKSFRKKRSIMTGRKSTTLMYRGIGFPDRYINLVKYRSLPLSFNATGQVANSWAIQVNGFKTLDGTSLISDYLTDLKAIYAVYRPLRFKYRVMVGGTANNGYRFCAFPSLTAATPGAIAAINQASYDAYSMAPYSKEVYITPPTGNRQTFTGQVDLGKFIGDPFKYKHDDSYAAFTGAGGGTYGDPNFPIYFLVMGCTDDSTNLSAQNPAVIVEIEWVVEWTARLIATN